MDIDVEQLVIADLRSDMALVSSTVSVEYADDDEYDHDDQITASEGLLLLSDSATDILPATPAHPSQSLTKEATLNRYSSQMVRCKCNPTCSSDTLQAMALEFGTFNEADRVGFMRNMLFATVSKADTQNDSLPNSSTIPRRKRRRLTPESKGRTTFGYYVKGQRLCRPAFAAVLQLSTKCIERHGREIAETDVPKLFVTRHNEGARKRHGVQKTIVLAFLNNYASLNSLECPRGRGSRDETPLRLLPSDTTKIDLHGVYEDQWAEILSGLTTFRPSITAPSSPISYNLFIRYWKQLLPTLRIASNGSDFCDTCTTLKNTIASVGRLDARYNSSQTFLDRHRAKAKSEFDMYKKCQREAFESPSNDTRHLVFDFAEKVLLPRLERQPGQLHFITGLKFDLFGVSCSNLSTNYIFGLTEGHWPNEKTANVVISMVHAVLQDLRHNPLTATSRLLQLHADNCSGQNKNRYMLWYLAWRVIIGLDDSITLLFLVAGHTKNVCDGSFGHVKRKLRKTDVRTPTDMMTLIERSASNTCCVPCTDVNWRDWKLYLSKFFSIPSSFKLSTAHVFTFDRSHLGKVHVKVLSTSREYSSFNLVKRGLSVDGIQKEWMLDKDLSAFKSVITGLDLVPSAHEVNRKNYLKVNILDRYFMHDTILREKYFESGSEGVGVVLNHGSFGL